MLHSVRMNSNSNHNTSVSKQFLTIMNVRKRGKYLSRRDTRINDEKMNS